MVVWKPRRPHSTKNIDKMEAEVGDYENVFRLGSEFLEPEEVGEGWMTERCPDMDMDFFFPGKPLGEDICHYRLVGTNGRSMGIFFRSKTGPKREPCPLSNKFDPKDVPRNISSGCFQLVFGNFQLEFGGGYRFEFSRAMAPGK